MRIVARREGAIVRGMSKDDSAVSSALPARRGRGRPVGDREGRRAELLAAAMRVLAEEGSVAASLRKVALEAGCTTGAVSYYFASKDAMMAALVESRFDEFDRVLEVGHDLAGVRHMFERWLAITNPEDTAVWVAGFQLLSYARRSPEVAAVYQRRYASYRSVLAGILESGQRQGWARKDIAADLLSDQLCAMGDGWMMLFPIEPERFGPDRVSALLDATMAIIAAPGATA